MSVSWHYVHVMLFVTKPSAQSSSTLHWKTNQSGNTILRPSILLAPCESNESLAKTFWIRTDVPLTKIPFLSIKKKINAFYIIIPSNKKYIFSEWFDHKPLQKLLFSDQGGWKMLYSGQEETDIKQTLNRHYLAKIKSCTTQFLEA